MSIYRALLRSGPKYFISAVVAITSITGFGLWWFLRKPTTSGNRPIPPPAIVDNSAKVALIESKATRLLLVDNDLYDLETGELVFKGWLKERMPEKLFWEPDSKTVLAQYERGFIRYSLDGAVKVSLPLKYPFGIADDRKWIVFSRDRDIWRADVDWKELKLANERKVTSIGQFNDQNFAGNIMVGTDRTLIVRNMPNVLRVNLETGDVKPTRVPLLEIGKRRSPDGKSVVGLQNGEFYCYDVDSDTAKTIKVGRGAITDYQWLDNDHCVAVAGGTRVVIYDRKNNTLNEVLVLPAQCPKVGEASSDGRFVFCYSWKGGDLVDLQRKTATPFKGGAGITWVSNDTFAFSREVPDSDLRGTWLQKAGEGERRISPEPYLVNNRGGGFIIAVPNAGVVVFVTKQGLSKMKPDGSELAEVVKLAHAPGRMLGIQDWIH